MQEDQAVNQGTEWSCENDFVLNNEYHLKKMVVYDEDQVKILSQYQQAGTFLSFLYDSYQSEVE